MMRGGYFVGMLGWGWLALGLAACASSGSNGPPPPAGSCHTGGSATGSYAPACNQCGADQCDAQLSDEFGTGWAQQYFGGNGACAEFNGCVCACPASGDPLACATTTCIAKMTPACQAAAQAANDCIRAHCATECR